MKTRKKRKFKKRYWLLIDLAIAIVIFALLLHKPARYKPLDAIPARIKGQVSPYLTHELLPQLYNGAQREEPFDLVVTQKGINEAIAWSEWPQESEGISLSAPLVFFVPDGIELMGTANVKGADLVVTAVVKPRLNEEGLLNLRVAKVKIGAMNITPLARLIAKRMYAHRLATVPIDTEDLGVKIAGSLLNGEPFEPVFDIADIFENENKKLRIEKITIQKEKLILRLVPAS